MKRKALFIVVFGLLYAVGTTLVMVLSVSATLSGSDPGELRASSAAIQLFDLLAGAMMFPLVFLFARHGAPWPWTYLLMFGNGVLWAGARGVVSDMRSAHS